MEYSVIISIIARVLSSVTSYVQSVQGPKIRCEEGNGMHERRRVADDGKRCRILQHLIIVNDGNKTGVVKNIDVKVNGGIREKRYLRSSNQNQKRKIEDELNDEIIILDATSDVPPIVGVKPKETIYRFFEAIILFNGEKITYHVEIETERRAILKQKPKYISLKEHTLTIKELGKLEKDPESEYKQMLEM